MASLVEIPMAQLQGLQLKADQEVELKEGEIYRLHDVSISGLIEKLHVQTEDLPTGTEIRVLAAVHTATSWAPAAAFNLIDPNTPVPVIQADGIYEFRVGRVNFALEVVKVGKVPSKGPKPTFYYMA